jgi:hypothetical protein
MTPKVQAVGRAGSGGGEQMELAWEVRAEHRGPAARGRSPDRCGRGRGVFRARFRNGRDGSAQRAQQQDRQSARHRDQRQSRPQQPGCGGNTFDLRLHGALRPLWPVVAALAAGRNGNLTALRDYLQAVRTKGLVTDPSPHGLPPAASTKS